MKAYSRLPGLVVVVCLLALGSQSFGFQSKERYVDGEVLVRLAGPLPAPKVLILGEGVPGPIPDQFRDLAEDHGLFEVESLAAAPPGIAKPVQGEGTVGRPIYLFRFPADSDVPALVKSLSRMPGVLYAEPNYIGRLAYTPSNDPYYTQTSDHLGHLGVPTAWDYQTGGISSVIVAVIDSGVDAMHPDLDDTLHTSSKNIADDNTQIFDDQDHGTRVAGIIAAEENNAEGIAGIAFGVQILSLDVTDSGGHLSTDDVIEAVNYAVAQGAEVINMSFEFSTKSQSLQDTLEDAAESAVLVAAAGNQGQGDSPVYPASFSSVLGVGATQVDNDTRATFSNFNGSETTLVDLVAPGKSIYSTRVGSLYDGLFTSGTSFSAPMVSGIAALLQSKYPTQSPQGIVNHLLATAVDVDTWAGYGRVMASNALSTALLPSLSVASVEIDDSTSIDAGNDADEAWDKGETVSLVIYLQNDGGDAVSVTGTLTTTDSDVTIDDSSGGWGNVDAGESGSPTNAIIVTATAGALSHNATMELSISATSTEGEAYAATLPFFARIENAQVISTGNYIGSAEHWTSDQTYEVMVDQVFSFGASLTVDPGTVIKMATGTDIIMNSGTTLTANGTAGTPILFTSLNYGYAWGQINIKSGATSSMQYCTVENGQGVLTGSNSATFANCTFRNNTGWGLQSTGGSGTISSCTATLNLAGGINDATRNFTSCVAQYNGGDGLIGAALTGCTAYGNAGTGLTGSSGSNCDATLNAGDGIDSSGAVTDSVGWDNGGKGIVCSSGDVTDSTASRNDDVGLEITGAGTALRCVASQNDGGGISTNGATVSSCTIEENVGVGVTGTGGATLSNSTVADNEGAAVSGVSTITACKIVRNGTGVSGASTISGSFIQLNGVYGVNGGSVSDSSIIGNLGIGISGPTSVTNSWILVNHETGIDSPTGDVTYCSIQGNQQHGVANIPNSASLSNNNIYYNWSYDYYDTDNTNTTGALWKDVRSNYWGTATTAEMSGNPAPTADITQIYDLWDNGLTNGYYANYGGDGSPFPGPLAPTSPVVNAPDDAAPAFLMEATPKLTPAVNVGLTTFTLVFSEAMDTSVAPAVTFDTTAPYTAHVVDASPGWVDTLTWQGVYAVDDETGDGENIILVSGAKALDGSVFDAGMMFAIDTTAGLSDVFNLQVATVGPDSLYLTWDSTRNISELSGFVIERSTYQDFHAYDFLGSPEPPTTMEYTDSDGLSAGTTYWYRVYESDLSGNSNQGGAIQSGTTEAVDTPTPTATATPAGTATPTLTPETGLRPDVWEVYR